MRPSLFWLKTLVFYFCCFSTSQLLAQDQETVVVVHPKVGEVIDFEEKSHYKLFPAYPDETFQVARFLQNSVGEIALEIIFRNGKTERRPYTQNEFNLTRQLIEVQGIVAPAQTVPNQSPTTGPPRISDIGRHVELPGKVYYIILNTNQKFFATIAEKRNQEYVFNLDNGSSLAVPFQTIRYMRETDSKLHKGAYWIPALHDSRMYFAPTGHGLKQGDGYLQSIDLYLLSGNYGITDNLSIGGMATIVPGLDFDQQVYFLTPKVSVPLSAKFSAAGGLLYARVVGNSFGVAYGAGTYGNTNSHLTGGIGFGFVNGSLSRTPIFMLGGVGRISSRVALMSENYLVPINFDDGSSSESAAFGLYGVRFIWPYINFDLGAAYYADNNDYFHTYFIPVFYGLTVKFGNRKIIGKAR